MKKNGCIFLLLILHITLSASPLHTTNRHSIIIDTDCAVDDFRAIILLISRPEISIKAILVSEGSLPLEEGIRKVKSLLHEFDHDSIPVISGKALEGINPPWREFNQNIKWGQKKVDEILQIDSLITIAKLIETSDEKLTIVCLGPLTNIAGLIQNYKSLAPNIHRIIWYNESVKPFSGFNYACDSASAKFVLASTIRVDVISNLNKESARFDTALFSVCKSSNTLLAKEMSFVFNQEQANKLLTRNHFKLYDDLVAIYLTNPELFDMNVLKKNMHIRYCQDYNVLAVREAIADMISGAYVSEQNIVFNRFPSKREMFQYDVRQIMDSVIAKYGNDEWKAIVITDEFHGHLGVFSIVGAKMGIKARELFGVGPDVLDVTTYAGSIPPYSCLNDGIQVSTGATLGMGLIHLATESVTRPEAVFSYKNKSVRITLKPEYLNIVKADINEGIVKYGLADDGYWKLIRRNALKYWLEWDRDEIFEIEVLN